MQKLIFILIIIALTNLIFYPALILAQVKPFEIPQNLEQSKEMGKSFLSIFPRAIKKGWNDSLEILSRWWRQYISPWIEIIWNKIKKSFLKEIERREIEIKKQIKDQKNFQIIPDKESIWGRFKKIIK